MFSSMLGMVHTNPQTGTSIALYLSLLPFTQHSNLEKALKPVSTCLATNQCLGSPELTKHSNLPPWIKWMNPGGSQDQLCSLLRHLSPRSQSLAYKMEALSPERLTHTVGFLIRHNRASAWYLCCPQPLGFHGRPSNRED